MFVIFIKKTGKLIYQFAGKEYLIQYDKLKKIYHPFELSISSGSVIVP